ncbi:hypothetical protein JW921_01955 [Candidatus Fermentibacterales bacterium]|nr:hypothetical protein [Candidatus Fermentibacterales bacterium]
MALTSMLCLSCAVSHPDLMRPVRADLRSGRACAALESYTSAAPDSTGLDRLLFLMEKGNLLRLAGRYEEAIRLLLEADRVSDMLRGTDLVERLESLITSEESVTFRGADYESVMINYCLATCYASMGNLEDALVECRRVGEKLRAFNLEYGDSGSSRYADDAFVRYVMGVMFEADGNLDDALVAYRASYDVYAGDYAEHYGLTPPRQLGMDLLRLSWLQGFESLHDSYESDWPGLDWRSSGPSPDRGELVVFIERGSIPERIETSVEAYGESRVYRLAVPAIPDEKELRWPFRYSSPVVVRAGPETVTAFLAEDLSAIARKNLEDQAGRALLLAMARLAAKAALAEAGEEIVEEITDEEDGCLSEGAGFLISLFGAATEHADLRSWLTLPAQVHVARIPLAPGTHQVSVSSAGGPELVMERSLEVRAGRIQMLFVRLGF